MSFKFYFTIHFLYLFININSVFGQSIDISVSKTACSNSITGYFLNVEVKKENILLDNEKVYYDYHEMHRLCDSLKIRIIQKLFQFVSDTSTCCRKVGLYDNSEYGGCSAYQPQSKNFSIGIEALFIINRICYGSVINRVSCYPVLYNAETMKEVNDTNSLINVMVERYKEWFMMYKDSGKLPDYRFLNDGQIKWWGR